MYDIIVRSRALSSERLRVAQISYIVVLLELIVVVLGVDIYLRSPGRLSLAGQPACLENLLRVSVRKRNTGEVSQSGVCVCDEQRGRQHQDGRNLLVQREWKKAAVPAPTDIKLSAHLESHDHMFAMIK
jgi:hypothetical protein